MNFIFVAPPPPLKKLDKEKMDKKLDKALKWKILFYFNKPKYIIKFKFYKKWTKTIF